MGLNAWTREGKDREADDSLGSTQMSGITMIVENDSLADHGRLIENENLQF